MHLQLETELLVSALHYLAGLQRKKVSKYRAMLMVAMQKELDRRRQAYQHSRVYLP